MKTPYFLQRISFPNTVFHADESLYVRLANEHVRTSLNQERMDFSPGGRASFDTFFNALSIGVWKRHCHIEDVSLCLQGRGSFRVRLGINQLGRSHRWIAEQDITLGNDWSEMIALADWAGLSDGMLYFHVEALTEGEITGGGFCTSTSARNGVRLGVVITHFNRREQVLPAISRISKGLLSQPEYRQKVALIVVDNSSNISPAECPGAMLIPNRNLGGSGGFTRGLLHLIESGDFTHCLFMDDDASCELESIRRTIALLELAKTPRFAVAGSLLKETESFRLFEKGAQFDGLCRPLKSRLDMRQVQDLLVAEVDDRKAHYGGWWFFAFALKDVRHFPFPFFVRGDDVLFCLQNSFNICTTNGVSTWGDDFGFKNGPLTAYLDSRSHLVTGICHLHLSGMSLAMVATRLFATSALSYNYASAHVVSMALDHVSQGPEFWRRNMDMSAIRGEIATLGGSEKMTAISRSDYSVTYKDPHEHPARKLLRLLSLNGFLLPSFLLSKNFVFQNKSFRANLREIFLHRNVIFESEAYGQGYIAHHDKVRFFKEAVLFTFSLLRFLLLLPRLRHAYARQFPGMTTSAFWREVYQDPVPLRNGPTPKKRALQEA